MDKKVWNENRILALKSLNKPLPLNSDIGVLKWKFSSKNDPDV